MINIFLFLSIAFLFTFLVGKLLEKIRIPWIFAALLFGTLLAIYNPFTSITSSNTFIFLAKLGMYFLLFVIGFEIDFNKFKKMGKFIIGSTFFIIIFEGICGTLLIHLLFHYTWIISFIVGLSFATVGEAVLIPILDEFHAVNTKVGQMIIGIGTFDDLIEISTLILAIILIGTKIETQVDIGLIIGSLFFLFAFAAILINLKNEGEKFKFKNIETLFLLITAIFFLFLGIGKYAEASAMAAVLAGMGMKNFIPKERLKLIENEIKTMSYGFFAPIFFIWVGSTMNMKYLVSYPLIVLLVVIVSFLAKTIATYIISLKKLNFKESMLLSVGLSVRFSTSIIIIKMLFEGGLIDSELYSVIIASSILFVLILPLTFSYLIYKWKNSMN